MNRQPMCLYGLVVAGLLLVIGSGCGSSSSPVASGPPQPVPGPSATIPGPPATIPGPPATIPGPPAVTPLAQPENQVPSNPLQPTVPVEVPPAVLPSSPPEPPATPTETVKAEAGVAAAGRSLDQHQGLLVTPAKAYFAVREKAVFQIQIPHAIQLYKAENPIPLTFDEFKKNILEPNKIKLPPLPPGHTYEWDPEQEQLMVKRPVK